MCKRLALILILFLPCQFAVADIASDLANLATNGLTVDQAVQNAIAAGVETPLAIAEALEFAEIAAEVTATALINAGILYGVAIDTTAEAYGIDSAGLAALLARGGLVPGTGTGGTKGVGGGGGGGGGGENVSPS